VTRWRPHQQYNGFHSAEMRPNISHSGEWLPHPANPMRGVAFIILTKKIMKQGDIFVKVVDGRKVAVVEVVENIVYFRYLRTHIKQKLRKEDFLTVFKN